MAERRGPDVTELLAAWREGDEGALDRLMPLVYGELRRLADAYLRRERSDHTLQPTAVIHEAYLRLVGRTHPAWQGRSHFYAVAAQLMRRILVDHARSRKAARRGGDAPVVSLEVVAPPAERDALPGADLLDLDRALSELAAVDERKSRVIELRYFGGLSVAETAEALGVSHETVYLDSRLARAWLVDRLTEAEKETGEGER